MRFRFTGARNIDRIRNDVLNIDTLVNDAVYEGGICTIFQETAYKVRQQVFMAADGRIDPAGAFEFIGIDYLGV